jgi:hypothetical protein
MILRSYASLVVLSIAAFVAPLLAQEGDPGLMPPGGPGGPGGGSLIGKTEGKLYLAPSGAFKVEIPVLPELGGTISDTDSVVTFQDSFNVHASIAAFKMDATQRWENETRGRKDYLVWFFGNFIQSDFQQRFAGAKIESAKFIPGTQEGSLLTFNLLPGGSMFQERITLTGEERPPVAKRGNLLFVRNGFVFVLSIELAEKAIEGSTFKKTVDEEDDILRHRLLDLLAKITFPPTPKPAK